MSLDLDFTSHLFLDPALLDLMLVQHLQGTNEATLSFSCEVYSSELSLAQGPANLEHAEMEMLDGLPDDGNDFSLRLDRFIGCLGRNNGEGIPSRRLFAFSLGRWGRESGGACALSLTDSSLGLWWAGAVR
jgi:hypothetical protein